MKPFRLTNISFLFILSVNIVKCLTQFKKMTPLVVGNVLENGFLASFIQLVLPSFIYGHNLIYVLILNIFTYAYWLFWLILRGKKIGNYYLLKIIYSKDTGDFSWVPLFCFMKMYKYIYSCRRG